MVNLQKNAEARTHNKGIKEMAGEVVNQTFVHLTVTRPKKSLQFT